MVVEAIESDEPVARTSPTKDYFSGGSRFPLRGGYRSVASRILEVTENTGPWLADLMLTDEKISGSIRTIKDGVLSQGSQITATVVIDPEDSPADLTEADIDLAFQIEDHCERARRNLQGNWIELLRRMMDAMAYRTMLGETVRRVVDSGPDEGLFTLDHISVKEPGTWRFVLDPYGNVRGIEGDIIPQGESQPQARVLPRDKFLILPWLPRGSRPWGQGLLGEAYNPWNFKVQLWNLLWKYVQLFAIPTIHASPGETAKDRKVIDADGKPTGEIKAATKALSDELVSAFRKEASLLVTPFGTTLENLSPTGNGQVFDMVFNRLDNAIVYAMHNTTLSLGIQSKRSSGTDAASGQDLLGLVISYGKWALKEMLYRDLWYPHVKMNWGQEIADRFTPEVSFGMTNPEDFSRNSSAVTKMYAAQLITSDERTDALRFLGVNFGRRKKKSDPAADVSPVPRPGDRPVNIQRRAS